MELSPDNIEELATALSSDASHQADIFRSKSSLSTLDVDRVISEAQDSLLYSSLDAIRSCDVSCSFNDILDDICKMNNIIELQQAAVNAENPQLPLETPVFYHMPDLEMQSEDYANQNDFLQPLGQWSEYLPLPPSALSTIQDIPQLAPIPTTIPSPPPPLVPAPVEAPQNIPYSSDVPVGSLNSSVEEKIAAPSVPLTPLQFFNEYSIHPGTVNSNSMQQIDMHNTNLQFNQTPDGNLNLMMIPPGSSMVDPNKRVVTQPTPPFFDWARVVPRRTFLQPSEIVVLRPLRTRKVMSSRPSFDLASYFDTSTISIPMIREKPRSRTYRRKQKLYTIPGADNLVFEVQLESPYENGDVNNNNNKNNNEDQLYPETEVPELDEIFKRKRRTLNTRRMTPHEEHVKTLPPQPPPQPIEIVEKEILETSQSPKKELEYVSDVDSDDVCLTVVKSMKCSNCHKLFKTSRSLTIHSKRCINAASTPVNNESPELLKEPARTTTCRASVQRRSTKKRDDEKGDNMPSRPLTRSQTRNALKRKASEDDGGGPQKQAK